MAEALQVPSQPGCDWLRSVMGLGPRMRVTSSFNTVNLSSAVLSLTSANLIHHLLLPTLAKTFQQRI